MLMVGSVVAQHARTMAQTISRLPTESLVPVTEHPQVSGLLSIVGAAAAADAEAADADIIQRGGAVRLHAQSLADRDQSRPGVGRQGRIRDCERQSVEHHL